MGTKTFNNYEDLLTFTRASGGHALRPCTFTETAINGGFDTDTSWNKGTGWSIGSGVASIDGSQSAGSSLYQSKTVTAGDIIRMTVEVTAITSGTIAISYANGTGSLTASPYYATSSTGTIQRIFTVTGSGNVNFVVSGSTSAVASVDNVSIATVAFDQPDGTLTLFEHPNNIPRVEWDADRNRLGLLVEESRTNLWIFSEDMSQTSFGGTGGTATTDQYVAPDGTQTGDLVTMTSGQVYAYKSATISTPTNVAYTISCYVKAAEANTSVGFRIGEFGGAAAGKFHDSDYTAISSTEWTRLDFTQTLEQSDRTQVQAVIRTTSATGSLLMWGAQLEQGSFPTSYIKTTSSSATRSADVASIPVADFGYNQGVGALLVEAKRFGTSSEFPRIAQLTDGTSSERISVSIYGAGNTAYANVYDGGVSQASLNEATSTGADTYAKLGFSFADNDFAFAVDGVVEGTDTSGTVPDNISEMLIGDRVSADQQLNGHIKSIKYYPRRLTNAQLQDITS